MNHYELLGVPRNASREEVRAAYLRLAREVHPDRLIGSEEEKAAVREQFKRIQQAYEVLRDPGKRNAYDASSQAIPSRRESASAPHVVTTPVYSQQGNGARTTRQHGARSRQNARRDVPDGWIRGSRRSSRVGILVRAIPRLLIVAVVLFVGWQCLRLVNNWIADMEAAAAAYDLCTPRKTSGRAQNGEPSSKLGASS